MERIGAPQRVGGPASDDTGDPVGHIGRNIGEQRRAFGAEFVEEHVQRGVVAAGSGPHEPAAVMIDDHDQIAVPALVGDLVDPDPAESRRGGPRSRRYRRSRASRSNRPCATPPATTASPRSSTCGPLTRPRDHRSRGYDRRRDAPTAPPRPSPHGRGTAPVARPPRGTLSSCRDPTLATADGPHPGRNAGNDDRNDRTCSRARATGRTDTTIASSALVELDTFNDRARRARTRAPIRSCSAPRLTSWIEAVEQLRT